MLECVCCIKSLFILREADEATCRAYAQDFDPLCGAAPATLSWLCLYKALRYCRPAPSRSARAR